MEEYLKPKVFHTSGFNKKSILTQENEIWVSNGGLESKYEFEKALKARSTLANVQVVKTKSIVEFSVNPAATGVTIVYENIHGKIKKSSFAFESIEDFIYFQAFLKYVCPSFIMHEKNESVKWPLLIFGLPLLGVLIPLILLNVFDDGEPIEEPAIMNVKKKIFYMVYNSFGMTGITIILAIIVLIFLFFFLKRLFKPPQEVVFSKGKL